MIKTSNFLYSCSTVKSTYMLIFMKKYFIDLESASILVKSDSFGKKNLQHWQKTNTFSYSWFYKNYF